MHSPSRGIIPADGRFTRVVIESWAWQWAAIASLAPGTSRRTRRIGAESIGSRCLGDDRVIKDHESNTRRVREREPVAVATALTASKDPIRTLSPPVLAAIGQRRRVRHSHGDRQTRSAFKRRSKVAASTVSLWDPAKQGDEV